MECVFLKVVVEEPANEIEQKIRERLAALIFPSCPEKTIFEALCRVPDSDLRNKALHALWWLVSRNGDCSDLS
jgi:hypothetical protein